MLSIGELEAGLGTQVTALCHFKRKIITQREHRLGLAVYIAVRRCCETHEFEFFCVIKWDCLDGGGDGNLYSFVS